MESLSQRPKTDWTELDPETTGCGCGFGYEWVGEEQAPTYILFETM
jgi:hypothetical protein